MSVGKAKLLHFLLYDIEPSSLVFTDRGVTLGNSDVLGVGYSMSTKCRGGGGKKNSPGKKAARKSAGMLGAMVGNSAAAATGSPELAPLLALLGSAAASGATRKLQPKAKKPTAVKRVIKASKAGDDGYLSERRSLSLVIPVASQDFNIAYAAPLDITSDVFPGQSYFAEAYGKWHVKHVTFHYEPTVTPYTAPDGLIYLAWTPDALALDPVTVADLDTFKFKASGMAHTKFSLTIPPSKELLTGSQTSGGQAANLNFHGKFYIITVCGATMGAVGKLEVASSVLFRDFRRPAEPVLSYFSQTTENTVPVLSDLTTGTLTLPGGPQGFGDTVSQVGSGKFADGVYLYWNNPKTAISMDINLDPFEIGDVFTVYRSFGIWFQDTPPLQGLQAWTAAGVPPGAPHGQLGNGSVTILGNAQLTMATPFQAPITSSIVGITASQPYDVTSTVPNAAFPGVAVNTIYVTGGGMCTITFAVPFAVDSTLYAGTDPSQWGWSFDLNLVRQGDGVLPQAMKARKPKKALTDWRMKPCGPLDNTGAGDTDEETDEGLVPPRLQPVRAAVTPTPMGLVVKR
jgi:hypothetical protein